MKVNVFIWVVLSLFLHSCSSADNQPVVVPKVEVHLSETVWEGTLTIGKAEEYPIKISFVNDKEGNVRTVPSKDPSAKLYGIIKWSTFDYSHTEKVVYFKGYGLSYYLRYSWWIQTFDDNTMVLVFDPAVEPDVKMRLTRVL